LKLHYLTGLHTIFAHFFNTIACHLIPANNFKRSTSDTKVGWAFVVLPPISLLFNDA
jgi:hypothetical protein